MANNKSFLISVFSPILILFLILTNIASAETVTFIKEYTYMASDIDSKISSRAISLEQAKRALLEQLGTYLVSETEVNNYQVTKDQVTILSAGIVSVEIVDEKWNGRTYYLKAKIAADPKEVAKSIDALRKDLQKSKELADSKKKAEEAMRDVERLKKELEVVKTDARIQDAYAEAINDLTASDWFDKGEASYQSGNYRAAIVAYDNAIKANSQFSEAYNNRGLTYGNLGNFQQAVKDYDKAIELSSQNALSYANRGIAYGKLGKWQQSIADFDKAIDLNPLFAGAYYNRGITYGKLGNQQQELKDFDKAIELNPKYVEAYYSRGLFYSISGNTQQAIKDLDKAIELNPQYAAAYCTRGLAYGMLRNNKMMIQNLKMAAKLGSQDARDVLRSEGIAY